ncbi:MAG TPA: TetR family transcriptional regulator, partial [Planctomycetota bacterium]|nr:TetR family transcriptional regulator [Planctomycetota bacterium]
MVEPRGSNRPRGPRGSRAARAAPDSAAGEPGSGEHGSGELSKGERTKERIVEAALELFRRDGYEATTMRAVAEAAGVALGNAYYYFASKDLLLQAFYQEVHEAHVAASAPVLAAQRGLRERLLGVMLAKVEVIEPYHHFSALMFRSAADPKSPLNPFHPASATIRSEGEQLFAQVLEGVKLPKALRHELPALLWTYSMGILLYWIHDDSAGRERTRAMVHHTVDVVVSCIQLAANPLLRPLQRRVLAMLADLRIGRGGA